MQVSNIGDFFEYLGDEIVGCEIDFVLVIVRLVNCMIWKVECCDVDIIFVNVVCENFMVQLVICVNKVISCGEIIKVICYVVMLRYEYNMGFKVNVKIYCMS